MTLASSLSKALVAAAFGLSTAAANAALFTSNFGSLIPGYLPNDDTTFPAISLPFSINYFGTTYNSIFINNNGNATFGAGTGSFTPSPLNTQTTQPMIAPYWTDLDSRSDPLGAIAAQTGGSGVYFRQISATQVVATWDRLGYFSQNYSGRAQFQLVLNDPNSPIPAGQGVIGFFYDGMTGDSNAHGVTVGFGDGLATSNPGEIQQFSGGSTQVAAATAGSFTWFDLNGQGQVIVVPPVTPPGNGVPEPGALALVGIGIAALGARRKKAVA